MIKHVVNSYASLWYVKEAFLAHHSQQWRTMINVTQEDDNTFTITWDENDPEESIFNTWTEEDFINAIQNHLNALQESGEIDINQVTEAVNQINDHIEEEFFINQTAEEVLEDILNAEKFIQARDQDNELSQDGTIPPPKHFPLFP